MAKETVYDKIIAQGEADAAEIIAKSTAEAKAFKEQALSEAKEEIARLERADQRRREQVKLARETETGARQNRLLLEQRKAYLEKAREGAVQLLAARSQAAVTRWAEPLLWRHLDATAETLVVNKRETALYEALVGKYNKACGAKLKVVAGAGFVGGFILQTPQFDIDNTYETLTAEVLRAREAEIAKALFAEVKA